MASRSVLGSKSAKRVSSKAKSANVRGADSSRAVRTAAETRAAQKLTNPWAMLRSSFASKRAPLATERFTKSRIRVACSVTRRFPPTSPNMSAWASWSAANAGNGAVSVGDIR